jgi:cytochrome c oxidase assembly protein subunit 15
MDNLKQRDASKQIATWLLIGVGMIMIQVLLGGITRLTESGLSITEWEPITGTLPPLNDVAWQAEFDKYKVTDQFKYVHQYFSLSEFKSIFFWEWFHRTWARLMGLVFLSGFIYFLVRKKFSRGMIRPMVILFLLGALQGLIG